MTKSSNKKQIPIQEGLFTWPADSPQLIASKCKNCGEVVFPVQKGCAHCTQENMEEILLSKRGKLWSWTVQCFPPPAPPYIGPAAPETFVPFGVGYIEFPEGVRVEGRLKENEPKKLRIDMEMELVIEKFVEDKDGNDVMTFAFNSVGD